MRRLNVRFELDKGEVTDGDLRKVFDMIELQPSIVDGWNPEVAQMTDSEIMRHARKYAKQVSHPSNQTSLIVRTHHERLRWEVYNEHGHDSTFYTDPRQGSRAVRFSRLKMELFGEISEAMKNSRSVVYKEWLSNLAMRISVLDVDEFYHN